MSIYVSTDARVELNGTDISEWCTSVEINAEVDAQDANTFGTDGWKRSVSGLKTGSASIEVLTDFESDLDAMLWENLGKTVTLKVRPTSAAISASNPEYRCNVVVSSYSPVSGSVGDLATTSIDLPVDGAITRHTTA